MSDTSIVNRLVACAAIACLSLPSTSFAGEIVTAARMEQLKSEIPPGGVWRCDRFDGGELWVALAFGYWLRQNNVSVEIRAGDHCASAAAVAALGGTRLFKATRGRLIFHGADRPLTALEKDLLARTFRYWAVPAESAKRIVDLEPGEVWEPGGHSISAIASARKPER